MRVHGGREIRRRTQPERPATSPRDALEFRHGSVEEALRIYESTWGPFITARELIEPEGRWPALRAELAAVLERRNTARDGTLAYGGDYLVVVGEYQGTLWSSSTVPAWSFEP